MFEYLLYAKGFFENLTDPNTREFWKDEEPHLRLYGLKRFVNYSLNTLMTLDEPIPR